MDSNLRVKSILQNRLPRNYNNVFARTFLFALNIKNGKEKKLRSPVLIQDIFEAGANLQVFFKFLIFNHFRK